MKKIKNILIDSGREFLQIIALIMCIYIPVILDIASIIEMILEKNGLTIETAKYYYLMLSGNWTIGFIAMLCVLFKYIRNFNKEAILNKGNVYHEHSYAWYWICSKILGYEKCNLVLVPIYMQVKLVLRDTFKEYPFNEDLFPEEDCIIEVKEENETNIIDNTVNLVIEDTYSIKRNQIPSIFRNKYTVRITRENELFGKRVYSRRFIDEIVSVIRKLPANTEINVFATTNPKNTFEIVKRGFCLANRGNVSKITVFQQMKDGKRKFLKKGYVVLDVRI